MGVSDAIAAGAALSAFSGDAQHNRLLRLDFPFEDGPPAILLPNRLTAREEVSRGFRFQVEVLSDDARIPLKLLMGRMATVSLVRQDGSLRYFNGYITEFRFLRTDGGFAFYQMVLEPWLAFARLRKNSVAFHGKSVRGITEDTLKHYRQAEWHMNVFEEDPGITYAVQYNETDYNHLHRRWEARGMHYWYEHRFDGHRLILSDKSMLAEPVDATRIDDPQVIPFCAKNGSREDDGIHTWNAVRRLGSGKTTLASFDYKDPGAQWASAYSDNRQGDVFAYELYEDTGAYGFRIRQDGEKLAAQRMAEQDKDTQYFEAEGNDRSVLPGRTFKLGGHFSAKPRSREYDPEPRRGIGHRDYLILVVEHEASNNYQAGPNGPSHYQNRFTCTRADIRWRPGRHFNSKPSMYAGLHTAIVVGPSGEEIHTDNYGRVKVQFHWDRLGRYDENSSPWIRVMTSAAGHEFGNVRLPRVGEEVAVVYTNGNIDQPLILGAVHNDAHMPPWALPEQASLTGLRSRELGGKTLRGNHIILDDTNERIQVQIKCDHLCSHLALGHIARIDDTEGRKESRGEGWELRTDGHGVARAAKGLLITTEERQAGCASAKDLDETLARLAMAADQHQSLAELAQKAGAQDAANNQRSVVDALNTQNKAIEGDSSGEFPQISKPHLVLASPAGIASTTTQSTHFASDANTAITAGRTVSITAGESFFASIRQAFGLFVQRAGLKIFAGSGDIDLKALTDSLNLLAKINITQTANRIVINAKEDIVINGGGSYVKISAQGLELGTNGNFIAHASSHHFDPANSMSAPDLQSDMVDSVVRRDLQLEYVDADDNPLKNDPIQTHMWDGDKNDTILDETGKATLSNILRGSFRAEQINRK